MSRHSLLGAIGLALFAGQVCGQEWTQEPDTVFGVTLGGKTTQISVPECSRKDYPQWAQSSSEMCIRIPLGSAADKFLLLENIPLRDARDGTIIVHDGAVRAIEIEFNNTVFERIKAILIERYGPPTAVDAVDVTSFAGASVPSEVLSWRGRVNAIILSQRVGRIDRGSVVFEHMELSAASQQAAQDDLRKEASKL